MWAYNGVSLYTYWRLFSSTNYLEKMFLKNLKLRFLPPKSEICREFSVNTSSRMPAKHFCALTCMGSMSSYSTKGKIVNAYYSDMWSFTKKISRLKLRILTLVLANLLIISILLIRTEKSGQV